MAAWAGAGSLPAHADPGTAGAAGAAAGPAESGSAVAETLAHRRAVAGRGLKVASAAFPVTHLAVSWRQAAGPAAVRVRTRTGWSEFMPLQTCRSGRDVPGGAAASTGGALIAVPGCLGYQVSLPPGVARATVTEINTEDGPTRTTAPPPASRLKVGGGILPVRYLSRECWGADESLRFDDAGAERFPTAYFPVQTLTVHHTGGPNDNDLDKPEEFVQALYRYQTIDQDFGDIGYHLLIDEKGRVYEGRYSGGDIVPVFGPEFGPEGQLLMSNAAHVGGFNAGNVGVALIGNFTDRQPTRAARRSLTLVLAVLAKACKLDPLGTTAYVNPINDATRTVPTIAAHQDWAGTECPGLAFAPNLPDLRRDVAALVRLAPFGLDLG